MIVDIRGTNTENKGAQLMLQAICARLGDRFELSVPAAMTDGAVRAGLGLRQTLCDPNAPRWTSTVGNAVPAWVRTRFGMTSDRDVDGILDASGFRFSDQFPVAYPRRDALGGRRYARRGIPKVLMPQAFGPFENPAVRRWTREVLEQANLVFVRDRVSEQHVRRLDVGSRIVRSPDFTIGVQPASIEQVSDRPFLALVPNTKLFTHSGLQRSEYVKLLANFSDAAKSNGLTSVVVVHETNDQATAHELAERIGSPVFSDPDPLVLKAALGQASAAVASRFHAVVGCVSQSVPTLVLGWSHKYRELLDDFGVADRLITPEVDAQVAITRLLADDAGTTRQKSLVPELIEKVDLMWDEIIGALTTG